VSLHIELTDELIEQLADAVAERLAERQPAAPEPWLSHQAAAEHLGISAWSLYQLVGQRHRNGLPVVKAGTRNTYRASALDAWREQQSTTNGGPPR
jgi:hypothetical protein